MVSNLPPLVADGGELRLARRVASFVYGRREVEWPEDVDDPEELLPDGREFGWVAKLGDSEPGLSERRFVRADVKINAAEGYSDVEQVLDDSALRAGGEVYFESVIEEDGLGLLVPGVDFRQGDLVDVRFWGRILKNQLVTSVDWVDGKPSVSLGGQSIRDFDELSRARSEMVRLINGERAERIDDVGKVDRKATSAVRDAGDAKETAGDAKKTAGDALQATQDNREYIDEQLDAAGVAVELGRQYLESMQRHVAAGEASAQQALELAAVAGQAAVDAENILQHLDPLRDDVIDLHEQVRLLGEQAAQAAAKAAQHVTVAASHVTAAQAAADAADGYAAAGQQHVNDAEAAAGRAVNSVVAGEALLVQGQAAVDEAAGFAADTAALVDEANSVLADTVAARESARNAVDDARGLLNNVPGDGRSVAAILAQVVTLHQSTLEAHGDVLDAHSDVLAKHGEAITAAADAAQKAGEASGFALDAAQQALNASGEAAAAAQSAGFAADDAIQTGANASEAARQAGIAAGEASEAARLNSDAIQKLADADAKLVAADEKLQQQIDVLEESQRLLAQAVQALAAGVAQSSMASQSALLASDEAGKAAGSALDAVDALAEAIDARDAAIDAFTRSQEAIDAEQNDLISQIAEMQKEQAEQNNGRINQLLATKASSTWPGAETFVTRDQYWGINLPTSGGALVHVEWLRDTSNGVVRVVERIGYPTSSWAVEARDDEIVKASWASVPAVQVGIDRIHNGYMPGQFAWNTLSELTHTAGQNASQGYLTATVLWDSANRGSQYQVRILVDGEEIASRSSTSLGPLTLFGNGRATQSVTAPNVKVPAGKSVRVQVYTSAPLSGSRFVQRATLKGTWIESA